MIVVSGRLQSRKWQDREGNNRTNWEVVADNVYFGESSRRDGGDSGRYDNSSYSNSGNSYGSNYGGNSYNNNSYSNSSYGGYGNSAPASNSFVELDDGDGELPF